MSQPSNIRIVDIAREAGVSAGTVDRVLHDRGRVSPEKREQVEKALKDLNYQPNIVARLLASGKKYSIAVILPQLITGNYWELVHDGITQATEELKNYNISISHFYFDQYNSNSFNDCANDVVNGSFSGVVMASIFAKGVVALSQKLDAQNIPYVYIDSLVENQNNLSFFGSDGLTAGRMTARLLLNEIGEGSDIFLTHIHQRLSVESVQVNARQQGFFNYLQEHNFTGRIMRLDITRGDKNGNLQRIKQLLADCDGLIGGVIFNSRVYELTDTFADLNQNQLKRLRFAGFDAIAANVDALNNDRLSFLLSQRPQMQGNNAVCALANYLLFNKIPDKINYVPIDILMKENSGYYNNYKL